MRVLFNGRMSAFQAEHVGSIPITCSIFFVKIFTKVSRGDKRIDGLYAPVAQQDRATAF